MAAAAATSEWLRFVMSDAIRNGRAAAKPPQSPQNAPAGCFGDETAVYDLKQVLADRPAAPAVTCLIGSATAMETLDAPPATESTVAAPDPKRWLVLAVVMIGTFMAVIDGSIVNVAIPA